MKQHQTIPPLKGQNLLMPIIDCGCVSQHRFT